MAKLRKSVRRSRRRKSPKVVMVCSPMKKHKRKSKSKRRRSKSVRRKRRSRKDGCGKKDSGGCGKNDSGMKKDGCDYGFETDDE